VQTASIGQLKEHCAPTEERLDVALDTRRHPFNDLCCKPSLATWTFDEGLRIQ
jgi:hypothetical protein